MIQASDVWHIAAAVIAAFGGSTIILLAASSWLGKVWASRILEKDRAHFQRELDDLQRKADRELVDFQKQLDVLKSTELRVHSDKLIIYRAAIDIVAAMLLTLKKYEEKRLAVVEGVDVVTTWNGGLRARWSSPTTGPLGRREVLAADTRRVRAPSVGDLAALDEAAQMIGRIA